MFFWMVVILLIIMAIGFILWPLLVRTKYTNAVDRKKINIDLFNEHLNELNVLLKNKEITDSQFQAQKTELESILLEDVDVEIQSLNKHNHKNGLLLLAILIPLSAIGFYHLWGSYREVMLSQAIERSVMAASSEERNNAQQAVISMLEQETKTNANRFDYWYLLGEFYVQVKNFTLAADAFGHAVSLKSDDADALAQYAQALYFNEHNKLTFEVTSTAEQALKIDPNQPTALGLLGIAAFENKQYSKAITYWQKILWIVGEQDPGASSLKNGIEFAKSILQKQGKWLSINVQVKVDSHITITPQQWLFIYARKPDETKPVAIVRMRADQLPSTVILDDTTAMPNGNLLSSVDKVEVVVRLSETGSAEPSPSDKQVVSKLISPSAKGENVTLLLQ